MTLESEYRRLCETASDIHEHLPTLVTLVEELDAKHVIELGTRSGVSTIAWLYALAQNDGRLTSVDLDDPPPIGEFPHWRFIKGDDLNLEVFDQLDEADIVFIDTSHTFEQTRRELNLYKWLVRPGGMIVLHDTELGWPSDSPPTDPHFPVRKAVEEFVATEGRTWVNFPNCNGLGVIRL